MDNAGPGFLVFPLLHLLGVLAVLVGIALLLMWAYKHLPPAQLKKWGITLLVVGSIVCLFSLVAGMHGRVNAGYRFMNGTPDRTRDNGSGLQGGGMMHIAIPGNRTDGATEGSASSASIY